MNTCPHCEKTNCVPSIVIRNAEAYDGGLYHVPCVHCGKMIMVIAHRTVIIQEVRKSDHKESDF